MKARFLSIAAVAGVTAVLLAGCTNATGIPALERDAQETDRWPGDPAQVDGTDIDIATARKLVSYQGLDYYVITSTDQKTGCLFKFKEDVRGESGIGGCGALGSSDVIVEVGIPGSKMALVRKDSTADYETRGWIRIHENILIGN